ncbi:MAG: endolytic transglycosylase MltG, partial [Bacteroidota bacterium]
MKKKSTIIGLVLLVLIAIAGILAFRYYRLIYQPNVPEKLANPYLLIPNNATFEQVVDSLMINELLIDTSGFRAIAERMNYIKLQMRAGRYKIEEGWSNHELIRHLRGGKQATVKVVLTNERLPEDVAAKAARFLATDSASIWELMQDTTYLKSIGYTKETLISLFIPNTYDFYWNSSPKAFMERMIKEHDKFWKAKRRFKTAKKMDMTPAEVYTLASIVERETLRADEKPKMARVYLNRLDDGMLLQA